MKQSTNYNMNKPDPNDMFSLEHWNQNTDKIDETLAPTFEDYTGETPVPTTDEALKNIKSKTKLSILMQNIKAFCKGCCTLGMLVDNCVTNNNNLPLAASQGKILMDQITSLNNNLFSNVARVTDVHSIGKSCLFRAEHGSANTPTSDLGYIGISVYVSSNWQFVICSPYAGGKLFFDSVNTTGSWIGWKEIAFK